MGGQTALYAPAHRVNSRFPAAYTGVPISPDAAPQVDFLGIGIQDQRVQYNRLNGPTASTAIGVLGWYGSDPIVINQAPATLGAANIVALANVTSGTAMTLAVASTGITVVPASTLLVPSMVTISAGLVLDGLAGLKRFGSGFVTAFYDRTTMVARAVSVTGVSGGAGGAFKVAGYDVYGYAMNETITAAAGVATTNGKKAFKIITSVTPQFTDAHNYSVGTTDIFGFGIEAPLFSDVIIHWNSTLITASTGLVAADTATATATTGDVRGTYAVQSASDGTKRLVVRCSPSLSAIQTNPTTGLFGVAQF